MVVQTERTRAALQIKDLTKRFGGLVAVNNLTLDVCEGEICALIGPNGSGKTTVLNLITGIYEIDGGSVLFYDEPIHGSAPHTICWRGIARTFQNIRILGAQTVFENALLGKGYGNGGAGVLQTVLNASRYRKERETFAAEVEAILDFVGLADLRNEQACNLPYGNQRILEIARALITKPRLLLLDEPAAGLNSQEIYSLMELISKINEQGITVLLIEHRMEVVGRLANRVFVLVVVIALVSVPSVLRGAFPVYHRELIAEVAALNNLDPMLLTAVIRVESGFRTDAVSKKGAVGLMQVMPETAAWLREHKALTIGSDDLFDPNVNVRVGAYYLKYLCARFPTEYAALVAYNAGPTNARRWLEEGIWDGSYERTGQIPFAETRSYVRKVVIMRNLYTLLYQ
jgi:branched-chain amino acid transport system ATP-binding protein